MFQTNAGVYHCFYHITVFNIVQLCVKLRGILKTVDFEKPTGLNCFYFGKTKKKNFGKTNV